MSFPIIFHSANILSFFGEAPESIEIAKINAITWNYGVFAVVVTAIKIVALVIGYLVVKLGYTTMMAGIKGNDSVELAALGTKFKFKGVTPGLALGIVGVLLMAWSLSTKSQFDAKASSEASVQHVEGVAATTVDEGENNKHAPKFKPDESSTSRKK
jgi:hypothetical protein